MTTIAEHKQAIAKRMAELSEATGWAELQVAHAGICRDKDGVMRVFALVAHDLVMMDGDNEETLPPFIIHSQAPLPPFAAADPDYARAVYDELIGLAA